MSDSHSSVQLVAVDDLHFDRKNPRLAEFGITDGTTELDILNTLWESMDVRELVLSMAASGFFPHEALIVTKENGRNVVIEGNRRLAALKVILNRKEYTDFVLDIPEVEGAKLQDLRSVPVTFSERGDSWRFLGFKHVNGAAKWTSYAKAKYIAHVHNEYGQSLTDIAKQIGDGFGTVRKLYSGLMVLEQANESGVYNVENRFNKRLAFSHLYTGLNYEGFRDFLGLSEQPVIYKRPVPKKKVRRLGEICTWLFGDKEANTPPAVRSQNPHLRQLNRILLNREAIQALRDTNDIEQAFEFTRPSEAIFEESLLRSKRDLLKAKSHLATGYDRSEGLLRTAGSVADLADSIYDEMERARNPKPKRERLKE